MKIKLVAILVAVITAGAAFTLSPLAQAENVFLDDNSPASEPPQITHTRTGNGRVYLEWTQPGWVTKRLDYEGGYNLFRTSSDGNIELIASLGEETLTYIDNPGAGTFEYSLSGFIPWGDDVFHSPFGAAASVSVDPPSAASSQTPAYSEGVHLDNGSPASEPPLITQTYTSNGRVYLEWTPPEWVNTHLFEGGYNIFRKSGDGDFDLVASTGRDTLDYIDAPGPGTFEYRLTAYMNRGGAVYHSTKGPIESVTVGPLSAVPATPDKPQSLYRAEDGGDQLVIFWDVDSAVDGYAVFMDGEYLTTVTPSSPDQKQAGITWPRGAGGYDGEMHTYSITSYVINGDGAVQSEESEVLSFQSDPVN